MLNFGLAYYGFQGDYRPGSFPDGGATSMWPILRAFQDQNWQTYLMYEDRDENMYRKMGHKLFTGPCSNKRHETYIRTNLTMRDQQLTRELNESKLDQFPELDILLMEWRWKIPGLEQHYLARQQEILAHYRGTNTKIFIWDTDHKLLPHDEERYRDCTIVEPSFRPKFITRERKTLHYAVDMNLLAAGQRLVMDTESATALTYVGNRYERDEIVDQWLSPVSRDFQVKIVGKWEPNDECQKRWPKISFTGRVDAAFFPEHISKAVAVPLLAKPSYLETGLMALRVFETVANGSIPISLSTFTGAHLVTERVAKDPKDLLSICHDLYNQSIEERLVEHMQACDMLQKFSYQNFFKVLTNL